MRFFFSFAFYCSYGRVDELVYFAGLKEQYEIVVHHYIQVSPFFLSFPFPYHFIHRILVNTIICCAAKMFLLVAHVTCSNYAIIFNPSKDPQNNKNSLKNIGTPSPIQLLVYSPYLHHMSIFLKILFQILWWHFFIPYGLQTWKLLHTNPYILPLELNP